MGTGLLATLPAQWRCTFVKHVFVYVLAVALVRVSEVKQMLRRGPAYLSRARYACLGCVMGSRL